MCVAIWIIAICEAIRVLQNMIQLLMVKHDSGERDNAYKAFVDSLKDDDKEMVKKLLTELNEKPEVKDHGV